MRHWNWLLSLSLILSSLAAHAEDPTEFCSNNPECSLGMISVTENYSHGENLSPTDDLSGFSGECFHLHPSYKPDHAHHGGYVFEKNGKDLFAVGLFGFFYSEDPFINMTALEMKNQIMSRGSKLTVTQDMNDHRELVYTTPTTEIRYWFRTNKENNAVSVIGRMMSQSAGIQTVVLCNMLKH